MTVLLERMSALEVTINLQQEQIDTMQNTIDDQSATIAEQAARIVLLENIDNTTIERLDTMDNDIQGLVNVVQWENGVFCPLNCATFQRIKSWHNALTTVFITIKSF